MEERIPILKNSRFAALVMAVLIIAGSLVGAGRSLRNLKYDVEKAFYFGANGDGFSIQGDLEERIISATNLITVARRYLDESNAALQAFIQARDALNHAKAIPDKFEANTRLSAAVADLSAELNRQVLAESDAGYVRSIPAEMQSRNDTISRDGYNQAAGEFNGTLSLFPARLFALALGIGEADYFR